MSKSNQTLSGTREGEILSTYLFKWILRYIYTLKTVWAKSWAELFNAFFKAKDIQEQKYKRCLGLNDGDVYKEMGCTEIDAD